MIKKQSKLPRRFRRGRGGFTLAETMVALIILSLLTMCIATCVAFGAREYNRAVTRSEARVLCSTLTTILTDELTNTQRVSQSGGQVSSIGRSTGGMKSLTLEDGRILLGGAKLIPDAAYSDTMHLSVEEMNVAFSPSDQVFKVELTIAANDHTEFVSSFDVVPLNTVTEL